RGSRTTENRPRPTSFTSPISSEATWATSFDPRRTSTNRSFIQTSSSSCCSPYTLRVEAGSRRTGSSCRMRVARPAIADNRRPRSRSTFLAWSATAVPLDRRASVLDVPSLEVVLDFVLASIEIPPWTRVPVGQVRQRLEVLHSLRADVGHLRLEGFLPERVLPDRASREEPGGAPLARALDESSKHVDVRARLHGLQLVVHGLPRRVRIEEQRALRGTCPGPLHLLHGPPVKEGREPPIAFLLVPGLLGGHEQAGAAGQGKAVDRRGHAELRVQQVPARMRREGLRDAELDGLHLRIGRRLRVLRMEHLLKAPPLVHRDHREATGVVRNLLEAAELADRNTSHSNLRGWQGSQPS